ncbi:hypothetical protein H072_3448 [Dactylellina haptotyla CBS 200.50]|uniref:Uncharacterized protein n=1 Tax=Dactylellina haptotyla (strain CBS 200.50) TaxID=1284197 RepID=S8ANC5_DACHA|nr:hypothetical protein H072_3448 [Dactylellina haptotyla CBS 200.50]
MPPNTVGGSVDPRIQASEDTKVFLLLTYISMLFPSSISSVFTEKMIPDRFWPLFRGVVDQTLNTTVTAAATQTFTSYGTRIETETRTRHKINTRTVTEGITVTKTAVFNASTPNSMGTTPSSSCESIIGRSTKSTEPPLTGTDVSSTATATNSSSSTSYPIISTTLTTMAIATSTSLSSMPSIGLGTSVSGKLATTTVTATSMPQVVNQLSQGALIAAIVVPVTALGFLAGLCLIIRERGAGRRKFQYPVKIP